MMEIYSAAIAKAFRATFKLGISGFIKRGPIIYFDIIKFDKWLRTPDGISTKDYLTQKYGAKASKFVERINQL